MNPVELMMRRRQVAALVMRDRVTITLRRATKQRTPAGGYVRGPRVSLAPQSAALVPFRRRLTTFMVNSVAGDIPELPYVLLGAPDMDIAKGDIFTYDGQEYEVIQLDPDRSLRTSAQVNYYGVNDGDGDG